MTRREQEQKILSQRPEIDNWDPLRTGVLLSDQILECVRAFDLIRPFSEERLKPAAYEVTVGLQYAINGEIRTLSEDEELTVSPFQVVVIQTRERLNLPRNMIARWNIKVSLAYEGLLWVGGPQVDPGYVGHLSCPIYNLSEKAVRLRCGTELAVVDFVKTTPFVSNVSKKYNRPPKRVLFEEYRPEQLKSALYSQAADKISNFDLRLSEFEGRLTNFTGITYTVIGVLVAALSIMVSSNQNVSVSVWTLFAMALSIIALALSSFNFFRRLRLGAEKFQPRSNTAAIMVGMVIGAFLVAALFVLLRLLKL